MNLLNVLLKVLLADTAISALSGKTGLSSSSLKKLLPLAIPLLLRYMTNNASSQSGALSLLGALAQHGVARSADEMLAEADTEDGGKIVKHILGDDETRAVQTLAAETDMSSGEVTRALNGLAPVLLAVLASAMFSANNQSSQSASAQGGALDLSNLLNVFGGASAQQSAGTSLLGSLLGGGSSASSASSSLGGSLLNSLLGGGTTVAQQPAQQTSVTGSLLNSLLGGSSSAAAQPTAQPVVQPLQSSASSGAGSSLLNALLGVTPTAAAQPTQQAVQQSANNVNGNNLMSLLLGALK